MGLGLGLLRLKPADFWTMTPRELAAALQPFAQNRGATQPLPRQDLDRMMQKFPDHEKGPVLG